MSDKGIVLDASAILATIRAEAGHAVVDRYLHGAIISSVNLCEVYYKSLAKGDSLEKALFVISQLPITTVPFDDELAAISASLHCATFRKGISFADRACLALALSRGLPVITGDRDWKKLDIGVEIQLFR